MHVSIQDGLHGKGKRVSGTLQHLYSSSSGIYVDVTRSSCTKDALQAQAVFACALSGKVACEDCAGRRAIFSVGVSYYVPLSTLEMSTPCRYTMKKGISQSKRLCGIVNLGKSPNNVLE